MREEEYNRLSIYILFYVVVAERPVNKISIL